MMSNQPDKRVIACNITIPTGPASTGSLAYLQWTNGGGGNDRVNLLIRSRGGRWIEKWEDMRRLSSFRHKTIPPEHPLYDRLREHPDDETLEWVRDCCARINQSVTYMSQRDSNQAR
jgi:hypothetical protein